MSKPSRTPTQNNDFDVNALLSDVSNHARDMTTLTKKVECLEDKLGSHEKIATTLSDTAKTAVKMQEMLADTFTTLLKSNKAVRESVVELVDEVDRSYLKAFLKRFGSFIGAILLLLVGAILKWGFDKLN